MSQPDLDQREQEIKRLGSAVDELYAGLRELQTTLRAVIQPDKIPAAPLIHARCRTIARLAQQVAVAKKQLQDPDISLDKRR